MRPRLLRARFAAKCEIEVKPYRGYLRLGEGDGIRNDDYGVEAYESWAEDEREAAPAEELEPLRIDAATPVWGSELDESILPAEAGLDETHISFTKGCYPGQEPIARLHYRGHPNRLLRVLEVEAASPGDEILHEREGRRPRHQRRSRPCPWLRATRGSDDALLEIGGAEARLHLPPPRP